MSVIAQTDHPMGLTDQIHNLHWKADLRVSALWRSLVPSHDPEAVAAALRARGIFARSVKLPTPTVMRDAIESVLTGMSLMDSAGAHHRVPVVLPAVMGVEDLWVCYAVNQDDLLEAMTEVRDSLAVVEVHDG